MTNSIYTKIDMDSMGGVDIDAYVAFVRERLASWYPEAHITIETTTRESGIMPLVVEPSSATAEVRADLQRLWEEFGTLEAGMDSRSNEEYNAAEQWDLAREDD